MNAFWFCKGWLFYSTSLVIALFILIFAFRFLKGVGVFPDKKIKVNPLNTEFDFEIYLAGLQSIATWIAFLGGTGSFKNEVMRKVTFFEVWMLLMLIIFLGLYFFIINLIIAAAGYILGAITKAIGMPFIRLFKK